MPNHLHGMVWINNETFIVGADGVRPNNVASIRRKPRTLSSFVAGFKSAVTARAGCELHMSGIWPRNYDDHIIWDDQGYMNIWEYIHTNPQKWLEDQMHPYVMLNPVDKPT